jgi:hypothetical protein
MIYEMRTYNLKPRSLAEVEKRFGEAYEKRRQFSEMAAFWHTDIGPLNQIVHIWPYESLAERTRVRAEAAKAGGWPPNIKEFIVSMTSDLMLPASFSPPVKPARVGPIFEMRTYTYAAGDLPVMLDNWERAIEDRLKFSPVTAVWYSDFGALNKFVHIWPYKSMEERNAVRDKASASGTWPSSVKAAKEGRKVATIVAQENKILLPASFSPLQ